LRYSRITPHCIKHNPDAVLDIFLFSVDGHAPVNPSISAPSLAPTGTSIAPTTTSTTINPANDLATYFSANPATSAPASAPTGSRTDNRAERKNISENESEIDNIQTDSETESKVDNEAESEVNSETESENETEAGSEVDSETGSEYETEAESEAESEASESDGETESEAESETIIRTGPCGSGTVDHVLPVNSQSSTSAGGSEASSTVILAGSVSSLAIATRTPADLPLAEPCEGFQCTARMLGAIQNGVAAIQNGVVAIQNGVAATQNGVAALHDQGATTQQIARQVWELQKQMNDRTILIQSKTEAILTQQLELAEYPIPRLFIVLPEEPTKYDPGNWFRTTFRLHFICECGEHTTVTGSKLPNHLHLAKHEGYLIREPTKFFKKYGPFLLLMLELIKLSSGIAGHFVPAFASLKVVQLADSVQQSLEKVTAQIDYSLECIGKQLVKVQALTPGEFIDSKTQAVLTQTDLANYLNDVEGLAGVELRQLGSFLKTSEEENLLGNLYRMTTSDGHVKWVCRDHYRASYKEEHVQKLRDVVKLAQGEFDEQLGKIIVTLTSRIAAEKFYEVVHKSKGVHELVVDLRWEWTTDDLKSLKKVLEKSGVPLLRLDLGQFGMKLSRSFGKYLPSPRYQVLSSIIELSSLDTIHIVLPKDFDMLSNFHPRHPPHLPRLSFELVAESFGIKELRLLSKALRTNSTLTTLNLKENKIGDAGAQALSEALETNKTMTTLDLSDNEIGDAGAQALSDALMTNNILTLLGLKKNKIGDAGAQALSEALKTNKTLTKLDLQDNSIWFKGLVAFSEALQTNVTLVTLTMWSNNFKKTVVLNLLEDLKTKSTTWNLHRSWIGDNGAQALSDELKTNITLTTLDLRSNSIRDNGAQALAEALRTNKTLTTLELQSNKIGEEGGQALSEALETNNTLTTLNLYHNSIRGNGAQALARALKTNKTLTTLDLGGNSIGENGAHALAEALKTNKTLTTLILRGNSIGEEGAQALGEALKTNSTLTTLKLRDNKIGENGAQALAEALKTNKTCSVEH